MTEKIYKISGMTCAACSATIEMVVNELDQVDSASVNLATEKLRVEPKSEDFDSALILKTVADAGYTAAEQSDRPEADYLAQALAKERQLQQQIRQTQAALLLTLPLLYISMGSMIGLPLPAALTPDLQPVNFALAQLLLTLPVMWIGRGFYRRGFSNLVKGHPNMDSLIAVGTGAAFLYSLYAVFHILEGHAHFAHHLYFESVSVIISLILLGKTLEARAKGKTSQAIQRLMNLSPKQATVIRDGQAHIISTEDIQVGDLIRVKPGERIPVDGIVRSGTTSVDEAMITGESLPIAKKAGDTVISATLNKNGSIDYEATKVGQDTTLAQIIKLIEDAQGSKAPIAALADKISLYFVPAVIVLALLAGLAWYLIGQESLPFSLQIFVSVLVIACPCALGLATPTAIMVGTGKGAEHGILIKSGQALEAAYHVDTVVLDKTGTITAGQPQVADVLPAGSWQEADILQLAASCEVNSEHPLAQAILEAAKTKDYLPISQFEAISGQGLLALYKDQTVALGNHKLMTEQGITVPESLSDQAYQLAKDGKTPIYLALGGQLVGVIAIADQIKASSPAAIKKLQDMGLKVVMLTGDHQATAQAIAKEAGITDFISQVLPQDKVAAIQQLQAEGRQVAMVGDGINDAPALVQAEIGMAIGSGTDVAIESADIVLIHDDLTQVSTALQLSKATVKNIKENLFWAFAYNLLGIPVAMGILYLFGGPLLNPMIAGLAMSLSSVSVLANALRLRYFSAH